MTHVCKTCNIVLIAGENWYEKFKAKCFYRCIPCESIRNSSRNVINNPLQMYVNGKYVSRKHPLHKAGHYKSFDDAAFSSLTNYTSTKSGHVYAMTNAAWPEWIKIGKAIDAEDRLSSYQTSSPMRDYTMVHYAYSDDRNVSEKQAHERAAKLGEKRNEWFKISREEAIVVIAQTVEEVA